jgi:hypothetical protein
MMSAAISEHRVLEIWQSAIRHRKDLITTTDGPVQVIYPGRTNDGRGADLKDAVITTGQGLFRGDIEIHVKSSAWWLHRHHQDPAYNQVVLHVVYEHDAGKQTTLQNGLEVPTLALESFAEEQAGRRITSAFTPAFPVACNTDQQFIAGALDKAGETRFNIKTREFEEALVKERPEQVLYRSMMTALGYSKNKDPMYKLAATVPQQELQNITAVAESDDSCLAQMEARLLGGAGLLPSQRPVKHSPLCSAEAYETGLEQIWESSGKNALMSFREWEFFKVRPGNYPTRRIAAMAFILTRMRKYGILEGFKRIIINTEENAQNSLEAVLSVNAAGYWKRYLDFNTPSTSKAPALVGKERAGEIIINVLLPFYTAYAHTIEQPQLKQQARQIFHFYPAAPENSVEKHMRNQWGIPLKTVNTALRRQGMLHIYKAFCTQGKCRECPITGFSR